MSATEWIGLISSAVSTAVALVSIVFASKANRLAKDANETSRRALAVTEDDTAYNWQVQFDRKTELVTITNDCAWPIENLEIVARFQDQTVGKLPSSNVTAFGKVTFSLSTVVIEHLGKKRPSVGIASGYKVTQYYSPEQADVTFYLSWCTETGVPRHDGITKTIG
mgnify:CR=1 FL=1